MFAQLRQFVRVVMLYRALRRLIESLEEWRTGLPHDLDTGHTCTRCGEWITDSDATEGCRDWHCPEHGM